ncbi:hypothetical protein [Bradyrhizobium sp. BR 10289]|uniref:hypothetical protein n=1 Tax=Bradyrhizobium sp. BR 10289 TaxID=2749993 RepID=UPI001C64A48C|nr:hypothetical protein [Bradyrhizobium sp. BR 10289]MBW7968822.1 hypothetical protein [Bradyrhizobium sp. BR 10289]
MFLKIVAIFYAVCFSISLFNPTFYETPLRIIGFALGLGGVAGLFVVAFKKHFLSRGFWRAFSAIYVGYQLFCVLSGGAQAVFAAHGILGVIGALASSIIFQFPIFLSLWRLSFATDKSGSQASNGIVAPEGHV